MASFADKQTKPVTKLYICVLKIKLDRIDDLLKKQPKIDCALKS